MIELFYLPGAASLAPHIALEEAGADYRLIRVTREGSKVLDPPEFLQVSPVGRIPAMRIDGQAMTESAACVLQIADVFPDSGLAPAVGTPERGQYYRWLTYLTNTVQAAFIGVFGPSRIATAAGEEAVTEKSKLVLTEIRGTIGAQLAASGPYLLGERYSAADAFLFMLTRWGRNLDPKWWDEPALGEHFRAVRARPAVQRVWEQEGLDD